MKNLKIAKKLFISYALILTLLIAGCVVSILDLVKLGDQIETFYDGPFTVNGSANIINSNFERMQKAVYRSISNSDPDIVAEAIADANDSAAIIQEQLKIVKEHFLGDKQIIERLDAALLKLTPMRENVLSLAGENRKAEAAGYMETNNILAIQEAQAELDRLIESGNSKGEDLVDGLRKRQSRAIATLILLGGISVMISILFGAFITREITQPVKELVKAAQDMAKGDLAAVQIDYRSNDELGMLAQDIRSMVEILTAVIHDETYLLNEMACGNFNVHSTKEEYYVGDLQRLLSSMRKINSGLSSTLSRINQSSDEIASGSEQVAIGAQTLAHGSTEQAASAEELSASINEVSDQVYRNAQNAQKASQESQTVRLYANESKLCMQEMMNAISEISVSFDEIRKVIKSIEDMAFQTNILALNAAVEAARAGEEGKGFSVVAREVRDLADKSAAASKSTALLIGNALQTVENGKQIADKTSKSLVKAVTGVDSVTELLKDITDASIKQSDSVSQIKDSIFMISSVVQTNSATAEESAAASEELSSQAEVLRQSVGHFKLKRG